MDGAATTTPTRAAATSRFPRPLPALRRLLHARYLRAVVTALAAVSIVSSFAATAIALRYGVEPLAVARFFTRVHFPAADLDPLVFHRRTAAQIERLFASAATVNPGGLVYTDGEALLFYPHRTRAALASQAKQRQNEMIFARLAPSYHAADVESLVSGLEAPEVKHRLREEGVDARQIPRLRRELDAGPGERERTRLLRKAAALLLHFVPYRGSRYRLGFAEILRFYDRVQPEGRYVGTFEVMGWQLGPVVVPAPADPAANRGRAITISRLRTGEVLLRVHQLGAATSYRIRSTPHPSGAMLYKVSLVS